MSHFHSPRRRLPLAQAGFTLIELLVVISIVSLLISILLPALSQARLAAQSTACFNNLRQFGVGFHMYTHDHDDYFPPHDLVNITGQLKSGSNGWNWGWMMFQKSYMTNGHTYRCPTAMNLFTRVNANGPNDILSLPDSATAYTYIGYGYSNYYLGSRWNMFSASQMSASERYRPARMVDIRNPSGCLVLAETITGSDNTIAGNYIIGSNAHFINELHNNNASNILWVDGHVSAMPDAKIELNRDAKSGPNRNEYYGWH